MIKIIKSVKKDVLAKAIQRARERGVILPQFAQQKDPSKIPREDRREAEGHRPLGRQPAEPLPHHLEERAEAEGRRLQRGQLDRVPARADRRRGARSSGIVGKCFPTGAHKVGAAFGCLVPRLVSGDFDPTTQKAVWPSTGNYCRGGAFDCALLGCPAVAILPEGMSRERFEWLKAIGTDEIIATPGTESNVKEIYDKCWELRRDARRQDRDLQPVRGVRQRDLALPR